MPYVKYMVTIRNVENKNLSIRNKLAFVIGIVEQEWYVAHTYGNYM